MNKKIISAGAVLMATMGLAFADDSTNAVTSQQGLYRANELSIDAFGADAWKDHTFTHLGNYDNHQSHLAAGLGVNYFIIKYVGVGVDGYTFNTRHSVVDNLGGNLIVRAPLFLGLAPYAIGGAGHGFDPVPLTYGDAGAGLELRLFHNFGIFADARYVWTDRIRNYTLGRLGLRLAF